MTLEAAKEMDRRCVLIWLMQIIRDPAVAFNAYSYGQQIEFAHDAIVLLKEQEAQLVLNIGQQISCKSGCCPKCGKMLNTTCNKRYCGDCGQAVKWDEPQKEENE